LQIDQLRNEIEMTMLKSVVVLVGLCALVYGHSYVTSPTSRSNQKQTNTGCRGPACLGPCDVPMSRASSNPTTITRGQSINIQWPRNNHAGGFIRFAWAPTSQSDSASVFDNGVQEIHCHEIGGCHPDDPNNPNGGDSGPADGSSRACQVSITVPSYLTDGAWTLQWAWFGGAFALGDYYSCVDYKVSGGVAIGAKANAVFYGGDYTYPGQKKCKFFNTDRLHQCVNEPCNNPVYPSSEQSGPAFGVAIAGGSQQTATSTSSSTTGARSTSTSTSTTGARSTSTSTTGVRSTSTSTTGSRSTSTSTTGRATTGTTTGTPVSDPGATCTLGHEECTTYNTYRSCYQASRDATAWSPPRSCQQGLVCKPWLDSYVICDRP